MSEENSKTQSATVIKKYANRRLYNTATSTYVTLEDLSQMVRGGTDFVVYDAKTGEDITRSVLTQIIFEEENKGGAQSLLPLNFLRQLIKVYGDNMQGLVPGYLEMSLDGLMKQQDELRKQMTEAWAKNPMSAAIPTMPVMPNIPGMPPIPTMPTMSGIPNMASMPPPAEIMKTLEDQTKRNMQMFQDAMKSFNPLLATMTEAMTKTAAKAPDTQKPEPKTETKPGDKSSDKQGDEFQTLKDQLAAMQAKLDTMSR